MALEIAVGIFGAFLALALFAFLLILLIRLMDDKP